MSDMWAYRDPTIATVDMTGFKVEALDGDIGKVDEASLEVGAAYIVVETGPWIFGKKVVLPAGIIDRADLEEEKVYVHRTKEEIKNAPEFDEDRYAEEAYRTDLAGYYGTGGPGYRSYEPPA